LSCPASLPMRNHASGIRTIRGSTNASGVPESSGTVSLTLLCVLRLAQQIDEQAVGTRHTGR